MKALTIALAFSLVSTTAYSSDDFSEMTLEQSTVQTIFYVVADMIALSSYAITDVSTNHRKMEAKRIQNDIQDYQQTGVISAYLADKINMVGALNSELSEQDSIDVLVLATDSILK